MTLQGCRVLVVEDEALIVALLEDMLAELGAGDVAKASSEKQALDLISAQAFDVAILDVNLNGERSFAAADALKARRVPFIFATGYGEDADPRCSGVPVIDKPYRLKELEAALDAAMTTAEKPAA